MKQSPRSWFQKASEGQGYSQEDTGYTLFKSFLGDKISVLIIYVDNIIVTSNFE